MLLLRILLPKEKIISWCRIIIYIFLSEIRKITCNECYKCIKVPLYLFLCLNYFLYVCNERTCPVFESYRRRQTVIKLKPKKTLSISFISHHVMSGVVVVVMMMMIVSNQLYLMRVARSVTRLVSIGALRNKKYTI